MVLIEGHDALVRSPDLDSVLYLSGQAAFPAEVTRWFAQNPVIRSPTDRKVARNAAPDSETRTPPAPAGLFRRIKHQDVHYLPHTRKRDLCRYGDRKAPGL